VVVTGSYGRNEASSVSDMDWFIISKEDFNIDDSETIQYIVTEAVNELVEKMLVKLAHLVE
jgi:signal-transduction protein with cAMP-binding, CBS, and nucleotidyltransferase domain